MGAGSPGKGTDKALGPRPARRTRAASAFTARAGGGASEERTRGHAQWEGQRELGAELPGSGLAATPSGRVSGPSVLRAQLHPDAAESGFLESNPGGYFMVMAS